MLTAPRSGAVKYTPLPSGAQRRLSGSRSSLRERSRMPDPSIPTVHRSPVRCVCSEESEPMNAMVRPSGDTVGDSQNPGRATSERIAPRSEEHTSELQSRLHLVCRLLLEKKNTPHT